MKRHLGRLPLTEPLPNTDAENLAFREEVLSEIATWEARSTSPSLS